MLKGLIQVSSLTSRRCFGRLFTELFKGEDQQLARRGVEGGAVVGQMVGVENCVEEIGLD